MFLIVLSVLWGVFTGHVTTYNTPGQAGIVYQQDSTHCAAFEDEGEIGFFGNMWGLTGGDCS